jgi:iron complex outermembrane receptor protein
MINVKDRIVLTGYFDATTLGLNVDAAQFFVNGADTKTKGLDVVLAWKKKFDENTFAATLTGNINDMKISKVNNGSLDEQTFFGERDKAFLLASAPESKVGLNLTYDRKWFNAGLSFTRFSEVKLLDYQMLEDPADYASFAAQKDAATDTYGAKMVTDLTFGFRLSKALKLTVGGNNIFNIYPDQQDDWVEAGGYWDAVQMGFSGAYYYTRLGFSF